MIGNPSNSDLHRQPELDIEATAATWLTKCWIRRAVYAENRADKLERDMDRAVGKLNDMLKWNAALEAEVATLRAMNHQPTEQPT